MRSFLVFVLFFFCCSSPSSFVVLSSFPSFLFRDCNRVKHRSRLAAMRAAKAPLPSNFSLTEVPVSCSHQRHKVNSVTFSLAPVLAMRTANSRWGGGGGGGGGCVCVFESVILQCHRYVTDTPSCHILRLHCIPLLYSA